MDNLHNIQLSESLLDSWIFPLSHTLAALQGLSLQISGTYLYPFNEKTPAAHKK